MNEIRPTLPNLAPPASSGPGETARAAQAAFFRAALGQQGVGQAAAASAGMATQLAAQAAVTPTAPAALQVTAQPSAERSSRPGALLDIRV